MKLIEVCLSQNHMATTFEFKVSCEESSGRRAESILSLAHEQIAKLEQELSEFKIQSQVWKINHAPTGVKISVPNSVIELLELAREIEHESNGAFDVTAKSPRKNKIAWEIETSTVWRADPEAHLGFGAIGKGYALDCVRSMIEREGFFDYQLSAGGSSLVISGFAAPGVPWSFGWGFEKTEIPGQFLGVELEHTLGTPIALGISGLQEQQSHILNPVDRKPIQASLHSCVSALVTDGSAARADALSTALFVAGPDHFNVGNFAVVSAINGQKKWEGRWSKSFQRFWGPLFGVLLFSFTTRAESGTSVDLSSMGDSEIFNPYLYERDWVWVLLPLAMIAAVLLHLKKWKFNQPKKPKKGE